MASWMIQHTILKPNRKNLSKRENSLKNIEYIKLAIDLPTLACYDIPKNK